MDTNLLNANYRIIATDLNRNTVKIVQDSCHAAKSLAGTMFHNPQYGLKTVTVADKEGTVYLYLKEGHPEATVNVPSAEAKFG